MRPVLSKTALLALLVSPPIVSATTIVEYNVAGADGLKAPVARVADGVLADPLLLVGGNESSLKQTGVVAAKNWSAGTSGNALKYIEFVVTPEPGYAVQYETIAFALFRENGKKDKKGPDFWDLYASTDAFATPGTRLLTADISGSDDYGQVVFKNRDISALGSQTGEVYFRFLARNPQGAQGFGGLSNTSGGAYDGVGSNVILTGCVVPLMPPVVPEPMSLTLLGLGISPLLFRRRG
jgi:hypothetical protein